LFELLFDYPTNNTMSNSNHNAPESVQIEGMFHLQENNDDHDLTEAQKSMKEEELSYYSDSENKHGDNNIWSLLAGVAGNTFERCEPWMCRARVCEFH
jgi:hypothetical protein